MSIWTNIEGTVKILKKDKVSVKEVFQNVLTDELCFDLKTEDRKHYWEHYICCKVRIDGESFVERYEDLLYYLSPIKGGLDLTCSVRFLA